MVKWLLFLNSRLTGCQNFISTVWRRYYLQRQPLHKELELQFYLWRNEQWRIFLLLVQDSWTFWFHLPSRWLAGSDTVSRLWDQMMSHWRCLQLWCRNLLIFVMPLMPLKELFTVIFDCEFACLSKFCPVIVFHTHLMWIRLYTCSLFLSGTHLLGSLLICTDRWTRLDRDSACVLQTTDVYLCKE